MRADIDAARGEEAGAGLEEVERGRKRKVGVGGKRAQFAGGFVGIAAHGEEAFDQGAGLARQPCAGAERRLLEEALGDLADRAAADRRDAGDRQKIGDERMRRLGIGAGERGEHAVVFRRAVRRRQRQLIEVVRQRRLAVEIFDQAALPRRREIERGDKGRRTGRRRRCGFPVSASRRASSPRARARAFRRRPRPCPAGRRIRCRPARIRPRALSRWRNTEPR